MRKISQQAKKALLCRLTGGHNWIHTTMKQAKSRDDQRMHILHRDKCTKCGRFDNIRWEII